MSVSSKRKKILILHTGGTIGMTGKPNALKPAVREVFSSVPELKKLAHIEVIELDNIDSSNVTPEHWTRWLSVLKKNYSAFDGFVVTHGTDTMAYSASAFSFALQKMDKPIVFTGSQRPLIDLRTDARDNLINAVEMAVSGPSEVSICFGNELFRGNRATKKSASDYIAFESFNFQKLAHFGVRIENLWSPLKTSTGTPTWKTSFSKNVFCLKIFPGINKEILEAVVRSPKVEALLLECFGSGNIPILDDSVLSSIRLATKLQKAVVIVSQCPHGSVDLSLYECSEKASRAGAVGAKDMTREAALVKLMHGLGCGYSGAKLRNYFKTNVCGEVS